MVGFVVLALLALVVLVGVALAQVLLYTLPMELLTQVVVVAGAGT